MKADKNLEPVLPRQEPASSAQKDFLCEARQLRKFEGVALQEEARSLTWQSRSMAGLDLVQA